jgi:hypothetical protein
MCRAHKGRIGALKRPESPSRRVASRSFQPSRRVASRGCATRRDSANPGCVGVGDDKEPEKTRSKAHTHTQQCRESPPAAARGAGWPPPSPAAGESVGGGSVQGSLSSQLRVKAAGNMTTAELTPSSLSHGQRLKVTDSRSRLILVTDWC